MTRGRSIFNWINNFYYDRPRERSRVSYFEDDEYGDEKYDPWGNPYERGRPRSPTPVYDERDFMPRHGGYGEPREFDDYYDYYNSYDSYFSEDAEERLLVHVVEQYRGDPPILPEIRHVGQPELDSPPSAFASMNPLNFFSSKRPRSPATRVQPSFPQVSRLDTPSLRPSRAEPRSGRTARTQPSSSRPSKSRASPQNPKSDPINRGIPTTLRTRRVTPPPPPHTRRRTTPSNPNPRRVTPTCVPSPEITNPKRSTNPPVTQSPPTKPSKALPVPTKPFNTCEVCADEITPTTHLTHPITPKCTHPLHWICKPCLQESLRVQADSKHPDAITCPHPSCPHALTIQDHHLHASTPVFCRLEAFANAKLLDSLPNYATCANRCCRNGVFVDTPNNTLASFTCPACETKTCIACKTEAHPGKTHAQNMYTIAKGKRRASPERVSRQMQEEAATARVVAREAKSCPNPRCGIKIQKMSGCDHMHCSKCKYSFCWICLARWDGVHAQSNTCALSGAPHDLDFGFEDGVPGGFEAPGLFEYGVPFGGGREGPRGRRVVIGHEFPFEGGGFGGGGYRYGYGDGYGRFG